MKFVLLFFVMVSFNSTSFAIGGGGDIGSSAMNEAPVLTEMLFTRDCVSNLTRLIESAKRAQTERNSVLLNNVFHKLDRYIKFSPPKCQKYDEMANDLRGKLLSLQLDLELNRPPEAQSEIKFDEYLHSVQVGYITYKEPDFYDVALTTAEFAKFLANLKDEASKAMANNDLAGVDASIRNLQEFTHRAPPKTSLLKEDAFNMIYILLSFQSNQLLK